MIVSLRPRFFSVLRKYWLKNGHDWSSISLCPIISFIRKIIVQVGKSTIICNIEIKPTSCELTNQRAGFWQKTVSKNMNIIGGAKCPLDSQSTFSDGSGWMDVNKWMKLMK